jgi:hypothetical protein
MLKLDSLIPHDTYNFRQKKHYEFLDGQTPIHALLTNISSQRRELDLQLREDADGVVTALFCVRLEILRMNPYILIMDCTYKTKKYI